MMHARVALLLGVGACSGGSSVATGQIEPWQAAAPLPLARANHCSAVIGDTLFVIGGNTKVGADFVKTDMIHAGKVADDGTITWTLAGITPSPVSECTAVADGKRLFLIDGLYDIEADRRGVFTANFDDKTGLLEVFAPFGPLPQTALSSEATIHDNTLLMMDTVLPNEGDKTITLRTSTTAPAEWSTDDWAIPFLAQAQYAFTDAFAYTIGGYKGDSGNPVSTDVYFAPITDHGSIADTRTTSPLPMPISHGEAIAVDDYVFVVGGRNAVLGAPGTTTVLSAKIESAGDLAPWQPNIALPMARTNHELSLVGDYLVVTGGAVNGPGDTTVLVTRVRFK